MAEALLSVPPPEGVIPSSLTPSSPVNNPGRQLVQQTQPQATSGRPAILAPSEENAAAGNPNEPKFFIHKIQVSGVTRLSSKQLDTIVRPYEEHPLGVSDINVLMGALTQAYVKRGYITTRVYLPQQNIQNGVLRLRVLEGRREAFSGRGLKRSQLFTAFPILPGVIIRLAGLDLHKHLKLLLQRQCSVRQPPILSILGRCPNTIGTSRYKAVG